MWSIIKRIYEFLISAPSQSSASILGRAAAIGGFILSFAVFVSPITSSVGTFIASIATAISLIVIATSEFIKYQYYTTHQRQLQKNKKIFDDAAQNYITHQPQQNLLLSLGYLNKTDNQVLLAAVQQHDTQHKTTYHIVKYGTGTVDVAASFVAAASAIYINFTVPVILRDHGDSDALKISANVMAGLIALFTAFATIANIHNNWGILANDTQATDDALDKLTALSPPIYTPEVLAALTLWKEHRADQVAEQALKVARERPGV